MPVPLNELLAEELCRRSRLVWSARSLKACERLEILCVLLGTKGLVRLVADDATVQEYLALAAEMGLKGTPSRVRQAPVRLDGGDVYTQTVPWDDPRGRWFSVFLGPDEDSIEEAVRFEEAEADSASLGVLLGYPACCIR